MKKGTSEKKHNNEKNVSNNVISRVYCIVKCTNGLTIYHKQTKNNYGWHISFFISENYGVVLLENKLLAKS